MADKIGGFLYVGANDRGEVVINLTPETVAGFSLTEGGHIDFSANQARSLAQLLLKHANEVEQPTLLERMMRSREEFHQLLTDADSWNENYRPEGAPEIDVDPDGGLHRQAEQLDQAIEKLLAETTISEAILLQRKMSGGLSHWTIKGDEGTPQAAVIIVDGAEETQAIFAAIDEATRDW